MDQGGQSGTGKKASVQRRDPVRVRPGLHPDPELHLPLVIAIARRMAGHRRERLDDLIGYGAIGLMGAARLYDSQYGDNFGRFAYHRIRGAILDGIKGEQWAGRWTLRRLRAAGQSPKRQITGQLREQEWGEEARELVAVDLADEVRVLLSRLPPRERFVLRLHYLEDIPFRRIGKALGISESRACQISKRALARLKMSAA